MDSNSLMRFLEVVFEVYTRDGYFPMIFLGVAYVIPTKIGVLAICSFLGMADAAVLLSDMANMYFLATSGVVSVFFSSQVFAGRSNK